MHVGFYEQGRRDLNECRYNENKGYVVFSAMGEYIFKIQHDVLNWMSMQTNFTLNFKWIIIIEAISMQENL